MGWSPQRSKSVTHYSHTPTEGPTGPVPEETLSSDPHTYPLVPNLSVSDLGAHTDVRFQGVRVKGCVYVCLQGEVPRNLTGRTDLRRSPRVSLSLSLLPSYPYPLGPYLRHSHLSPPCRLSVPTSITLSLPPFSVHCLSQSLCSLSFCPLSLFPYPVYPLSLFPCLFVPTVALSLSLVLIPVSPSRL